MNAPGGLLMDELLSENDSLACFILNTWTSGYSFMATILLRLAHLNTLHGSVDNWGKLHYQGNVQGAKVVNARRRREC